MSNKAPAFQFYPDKWAIDTRRLTWKAKGIYMELLGVLWTQHQADCSIPDDPKIISSEVGCTTKEWLSARAELLHEYRPIMRLEKGRLLSLGLLKESRKQLLRRQKLSRAGKRGGRPKKPMESLSSSSSTLVEENRIKESDQSCTVADVQKTPARFPTIEECRLAAATVGMTDRMITEFFNHYDSQGWKKSSGLPLTNLRSAMQAWKTKNQQFNPNDHQHDKPKTIIKA